MKKINADLFEKLSSVSRSGYLGLSWCVCDAEGNRCDDEVVKEGRYICAENYYGYAVLYVDKGMVLVECEGEENE